MKTHPLQDVFQQTGDDYRPFKQRADYFCPPDQMAAVAPTDKIGIVLDWPRNIAGWMTIDVSARFGSETIAPEQDPKRIETVKKIVSYTSHALKTYVAFIIPRTAELVIHFTIHTDSDAFRNVVEAAQEDSATSPRVAGQGSPSRSAAPAKTRLSFKVGVVTAVGGAHKLSLSDELEVSISDCCLPPEYKGVVAIDFGNAATTIACLHADDTGVEQIETVDVRPNDKIDLTPIPTVLRMTSAELPTMPEAGRPALPAEGDSKRCDYMKFSCLIGEDATRNARPDQQRRNIYGAKRMLVDIHNDPPFQLHADDGSVTCRRRLLAELFLTEAIRGFIKRKKCRPKKIVLTCPTAFLPPEHRNLKEAASRAMFRALNPGKAVGGEGGGYVDKYVAAVIDEATAAAFYFMYRHFIDTSGAVPGLRYNNSRGIHALLIDCGGGTTDIALVKVMPQSGQSVALSVLGRAGHRTFGGDFITKQLFYLLKAKILVELRTFGDIQPPSSANWKDFIKKYGTTMAQAVPTKFKPAKENDTDNDGLRDATFYLWTLAEAFKRTLSAESLPEPTEDDTNHKVKVTDKTDVNLHHVMSHCPISSDLIPKAAAALGISADLLYEIRVQRSELNELIREEAIRTVKYANHLISRLRLQHYGDGDRRGLTPPSIDRVYLVGNASKYPFIRESLINPEYGLQIPFLVDRSSAAGGPVSSRRQVLVDQIDSEDMKAAVVKGAVLAHKVRVQGLNVEVTWDHDLINKLPFDIIHKGLGYPQKFKSLYPEGTRYDDCEGATLEQTALAGVATVEAISLHKLWPGDGIEDATIFGTFKFPAAVAGVMKCDYGEQGRFYLEGLDGAAARTPAEPPDEKDHLGPIQSGEL